MDFLNFWNFINYNKIVTIAFLKQTGHILPQTTFLVIVIESLQGPTSRIHLKNLNTTYIAFK